MNLNKISTLPPQQNRTYDQRSPQQWSLQARPWVQLQQYYKISLKSSHLGLWFVFIYSTLVSDGASFSLQSWWSEVCLHRIQVMDKDIAQHATEGVFKLSLAGSYRQAAPGKCCLLHSASSALRACFLMKTNSIHKVCEGWTCMVALCFMGCECRLSSSFWNEISLFMQCQI